MTKKWLKNLILRSESSFFLGSQDSSPIVFVTYSESNASHDISIMDYLLENVTFFPENQSFLRFQGLILNSSDSNVKVDVSFFFAAAFFGGMFY